MVSKSEIVFGILKKQCFQNPNKHETHRFRTSQTEEDSCRRKNCTCGSCDFSKFPFHHQSFNFLRCRVIAVNRGYDTSAFSNAKKRYMPSRAWSHDPSADARLSHHDITRALNEAEQQEIRDLFQSRPAHWFSRVLYPG